jgi:C4-dicarboxylate-specific signal transduction histidine kinase
MSSNGIVSVEVKDAGNPSLEDLENALTPHHKGKKSKGLGIGLSIVNRKINEVGGTLDIQANPTRFTMKFKLVEQE